MSSAVSVVLLAQWRTRIYKRGPFERLKRESWGAVRVTRLRYWQGNGLAIRRSRVGNLDVVKFIARIITLKTRFCGKYFWDV